MSIIRTVDNLQPVRDDRVRSFKHFAQAVVFVAIAIILAKWGAGLPEWRDVIASENGPVERMSAAVWFMGFVWCLGSAYSQRALAIEWLGFAMFFLLFGLRELDAHVWATGWNLDKFANYWNPHYPLLERMVVLGLLIFPCLIVGGILCYRLWKMIGRAWSEGASWLSHLILGLGLLVLCVTLDKVGPYGLFFLEISDSGKVLLMIIEEFLELVLAVFALVSLWPYLQEALLCHESPVQNISRS